MGCSIGHHFDFFFNESKCNLSVVFIHFVFRRFLQERKSIRKEIMACSTPSNICATCLTLPTEHKQKPGILLCIGCQKYFFSQHIVEHRQSLAELLNNEVINERNALKGKFSKLSDQYRLNMQENKYKK